jgi:hypothetical protein
MGYPLFWRIWSCNLMLYLKTEDPWVQPVAASLQRDRMLLKCKGLEINAREWHKNIAYSNKVNSAHVPRGEYAHVANPVVPAEVDFVVVALLRPERCDVRLGGADPDGARVSARGEHQPLAERCISCSARTAEAEAVIPAFTCSSDNRFADGNCQCVKEQHACLTMRLRATEKPISTVCTCPRTIRQCPYLSRASGS